MKRQVEEARRAGERGSQQLKGEVQEQDLAQVLAAAFPGDEFERIAKGQAGADILQHVVGRTGQVAAASFGRRSGRRTGATSGYRSCVMTSGRSEHTSRDRDDDPATGHQ